MDSAHSVETIIRYDGPALAGNEMDVEALAPALLSLAALIKLANTELNGPEAAPIRVVVDANVEQKCFQLKLKAIHSFIEAAKDFFNGDEVSTLKTLLEWLGLTGTGALSLFKVLKLLGKEQPSTSITTGDGSTVYNIVGNPVFNGISPEVLKLLANPAVVDKAKGFLEPLRREGYETVGIYDQRGAQAFGADKSEAKAILALPAPTASDETTENDGEPTIAVGPAWVATSQFKGSAKWALMWNGVKIDAKMPDDFLQKFQDNDVLVVPNAKLTVQMKIVPKIDKNGNPLGASTFTVTEVTAVELPEKMAKQTGLFDDDPA